VIMLINLMPKKCLGCWHHLKYLGESRCI
jgi:hypothetical protein